MTLSLFAAAGVLLVAFVAIECRAAHPLLPLRVVLERNRGGSFLASLLVGTAMLGTFLSLTYYFQGTLHYSALKSGFAFVPFSLGIITGATAASRLLPRFGPRLTHVVRAGPSPPWGSRSSPRSTPTPPTCASCSRPR